MKNLFNRLLAALFCILYSAIMVFAILIPWMSGCSTFKTAWTPENRSATIAKLESDAKAALGTGAVAALQGAASSNGDFAHSAALAVWQSGALGDIEKGVVDAGGSPQLAALAASVARQANAGQVTKRDAINAVASAISAAALVK